MVMKIGTSLCILGLAFGFTWAGAAERPPSVGAPICAPNANFKVADFSMALSTPAIDRMRRLGDCNCVPVLRSCVLDFAPKDE